MGFKLNEQSLSMLDGPWLQRQVEGHLIFGPFSRHFGFGWIIVAASTLNVLTSLHSSLNAVEIEQLLEKLFFLAVSFIYLKVSVYRQAAIGWCLTKFMLAVLCFLTLLVGGLVGFFQHKPDAIHAALISIIWFPSIEFIPGLQQKQKMMTIARLLVTPIVLYFWYQTGTWH